MREKTEIPCHLCHPRPVNPDANDCQKGLLHDWTRPRDNEWTGVPQSSADETRFDATPEHGGLAMPHEVLEAGRSQSYPGEEAPLPVRGAVPSTAWRCGPPGHEWVFKVQRWMPVDVGPISMILSCELRAALGRELRGFLHKYADRTRSQTLSVAILTA